MAHPPLRLVLTMACGVAVGTSVKTGVGVIGRTPQRAPVPSKLRHCRLPEQSEFFSHRAPSVSGGTQRPSKLRMSQRSSLTQRACWQHVLCTQLPLLQTSGLFGLQRSPFGRRVGVGVGSSVQKPGWLGSRQVWFAAHSNSLQQMNPSLSLQKKPGWQLAVS